MSVPEKHSIKIAGCEHVEVANPQLLVVKPRKIFWCIWVFIYLMTWQIDSLLKPETSATNLHSWSFRNCLLQFNIAVQKIVFLQLIGTIDASVAISTCDSNLISLATDSERLCYADVLCSITIFPGMPCNMVAAYSTCGDLVLM